MLWFSIFNYFFNGLCPLKIVLAITTLCRNYIKFHVIFVSNYESKFIAKFRKAQSRSQSTLLGERLEICAALKISSIISCVCRIFFSKPLRIHIFLPPANCYQILERKFHCGKFIKNPKLTTDLEQHAP